MVNLYCSLLLCIEKQEVLRYKIKVYTGKNNDSQESAIIAGYSRF